MTRRKGIVESVNRSSTHKTVKPNRRSIRLLRGLGVEGDAHHGTTVKHRSRVTRDLKQPNLRQVHLIHAELHDELSEAGFNVTAGQMGENITYTRDRSPKPAARRQANDRRCRSRGGHRPAQSLQPT